MDELEGYLDQMDELTRETTASINTEYLQELESQRDALANHIISASLQATRLPIEGKRKAGKEIYIVVKPYQGIGREPNEQETALINNMLGDIESHNLSSQMTLLGIDDVAAELKRINEEKHENWKQRMEDAKVRKQELINDQESQINRLEHLTKELLGESAIEEVEAKIEDKKQLIDKLKEEIADIDNTLKDE